jgi:O-antigen ligase
MILEEPIRGLPAPSSFPDGVASKSPHNLFLTASGYYGIIGGVALFLIYMSTFKNALQAARDIKNSALMGYRRWLFILVSANIGVIGHGLFHNASILLGEMRAWIWIGSLWGVLMFLRRKTVSGQDG